MHRRTFLLAATSALLATMPLPLFAANKKKKDKKNKKENDAKNRKRAQQTKDKVEAFKKLDKNHDGFLSGDEIPKGADKADRNGDGRLSRSEFSRGGGKAKKKNK